MGTLIRATFLALTLIVPATSGLAGDGHRGGAAHQPDMRFHDQRRSFQRHDRFFRHRDGFFRHHDRFFFGSTEFFAPAPFYPYPLFYDPSYYSPVYYWYCANPPGYYPFVSRCLTSWQAVPAPPG